MERNPISGLTPGLWALCGPLAASAFGRQERPAYNSGAIGVLPILGILKHRGGPVFEALGGSSIQRLSAAFRELVDAKGVSSIVLEIDSPGGQIQGVEEFAQEIFDARGRKPVTAMVNGAAASAAYVLAAAASEVVVTPSGELGAIGVFYVHEDDTKMMERLGIKRTIISAGKHKAAGWRPLTAEDKAYIQAQADEHYGRMVDFIARSRRTSPAKIRNGYGEGRVVTARRALKLGMADRIGTMPAVLKELAGGVTQRRAMVAQARQRLERSRQSLILQTPEMRAPRLPVVIEGYAALWHTIDPTNEDCHEIMTPRTFDRSLVSKVNILGCIDHKEPILAQTSDGTLRPKADKRGLRFQLYPPDTPAGRQAVADVRSGVLKGASVKYIIRSHGWAQANGRRTRIVFEAALLDVALVTRPACKGTTVSVRNLGSRHPLGHTGAGRPGTPQLA